MGKSYKKKWTGVFGNPVDDNPTVVMDQEPADIIRKVMEKEYRVQLFYGKSEK